MTIRSARLFEDDGTPAPMMFSEWRRKGALQTLQTTVRLVGLDGLATDYFRSLWKRAFPDKRPLPMEKLAHDDGTGTFDFWNVFT